MSLTLLKLYKMVSAVVFRPPQPATKQADTKIEKIPFLTGLMNYGKRITLEGSNGGAGGATVIYTVPTGKYFYLFSATLHVIALTAGFSNGRMFIYPEAQGALMKIEVQALDQSLINSINPSLPIKCLPGNIIYVQNLNVSTNTFGTIFGYEVDISLIPLFL